MPLNLESFPVSIPHTCDGVYRTCECCNGGKCAQWVISWSFSQVSATYLKIRHSKMAFMDAQYLYYNYEKYLLSSLKQRSQALIEQYLPNISDPVYSVHQSFIWFLWLNWRNSIFYPVTAPNGSKCWPIVMSSIQEPVASNCDVTMTDCQRVVAMDAFLAQWWGQWSQHSGRPRTFLALITLVKLIFILFCDPRVSTRGITNSYKL